MPEKKRAISIDTGVLYTYKEGDKVKTAYDSHHPVSDDELDRLKDLNMNAVRIHGDDPETVIETARRALERGIDVWLSPRFIDADSEETLRRMGSFAERAEGLREQYGDREVVLAVGNELGVDSRFFFDDDNYVDRTDRIVKEVIKGDSSERERFKRELNSFLAEMVGTVKGRFKGPITYAAHPAEVDMIDWEPFDVVGANLYFDRHSRKGYFQRIEELKGYGKPVVVTEFGSATFTGASDYGGAAGFVASQKEIQYDESEQVRLFEEVLPRVMERSDGVIVYALSEFPKSKGREGPAGSYGVLDLRDGEIVEKEGYRALKKTMEE